MKCEICHEADAETVLHLKKDGQDRELYVCKKCASEARHSKEKKNEPEEGDNVSVIGPGEKPPPFVENFFKAAMGLVDGLGHLEEERRHGKKTCPLCHATWETLEQRGTLGCPRCWKTFGAEIRAKFLRGDYGQAHVGSMPAGTTGTDSRAYLERELKKAIKLQKYERAAEIQRCLDALESDADGKETT
ncbi:MAG: hypothetical protein IJQ00_03430 [Kiritimatiellae bacterium]|nr:hypothetical protein [Kiritimatiellia bacterium]